MKEDIEIIIVEFNNYAVKIYSTLSDEFFESVRHIDRNGEENVFKLQEAKFMNTLKYQLDEQAKIILETADSKIHTPLEAELSVKINYYLQEFQLKCNAL